MPRQPQSTGLFGQTPQAIRQAQINEQLSQASLIGNLSPGGHGALAGGMFGQAAGNALGMLAGQDVSDPRLKQAQALQEIEQQITQMGLEPGTQEFTQALGQLATMKLGVGAAAPIVQKAQELEMERAEIDQLRQGPALLERRKQGYIKILTGNRFKFSVEEAAAIAQDDKLAAEIIQKGMDRKELTAAIENYQYGLQNPGFARREEQLKRSSAIKINTFAAKPLGTDAASWQNGAGAQPSPALTAEQAAAQGYVPMTAAAKAKAAKEATQAVSDLAANEEVQAAIDQVNAIVSTLGAGSFISPTDRNRYANVTQRLAKAVAQSRNPPGTEASQQAENRLLAAMPSLKMVLANPAALTAVINDMSQEAGGANELEDKYLKEARARRAAKQ